MKGRIIYSCFFFWLFVAGLSFRSFAQTISNVTFPITSACAGTNTGLTVSYTASTSFAAGNVFTAYLSDATGTSYPTVIGSIVSRTATPISATILASIASGSGYKIQVRASSGTFANSASTLLINSQPVVPGVTTPLTYCEGDLAVALTASKSSGGTLNWYVANQTTGSTSTQAPTPSTAAAAIGTTIYYVSQTVSGCESPKSSITVTVRNKLNAPVAKSPQTICQGESPKSLTATLSDGGTQLKWYTALSGGTALASAPQPSVNSTYYVSQSNATDCESDRTPVAFQVVALPSAPTVKNPSPYCQGILTDPLSATPTGTNALLWWGTSASGGTSTTTAPSPGSQASATYYVSQIDNNGCQSANRSPISVSVVATPIEPTVQGPPAVCAGSPVGSLSATVTSSDYELRWWGTAQTGGTSTTTAPTVSNTQTATYFVSQVAKVGGCSSPRKGITVTINSLPAVPTVSSPVIYCQGKPSRPLQASAGSGATLNWYGTIDKDKGGSASAQAPSPPTDQVKTSLYYVSQTSDKGCESQNRAIITVTVNKTPDRPSVTTPRVYCEGETADLLAATTTGTLNWYGTDSTSSPSTSATRPQTGASFVGTQNYYVSQTVSGCTSSLQAIPVQVKDTPNAPSTSAIDFCQGTGAPALTAALVANATANWYGTSSGGLASPTAPVPPNSNVGTTLYYVSQTVAGCESPRATLSVRVKATPGAPETNPTSFCNRSQTQQLTASGSGLKWYDASDNFLNGGAPTPSSDAVGSQTFKVSQTIESCEGPKATITVTIKPLPDKPGVSNPVYCLAQQDQPQQNITSLAANVTGLGFKWYTTAGSLLPNAPIPSITQVGTQKYLVSQTISDCESEKTEIQATILTPAAPVTPKPLVTYCINDKAVPLEATGETGSQLRWIDPYGNVTSNAPTPSTLNTNVQLQGDPFYVYQIASYGCYSARSTIRVVVNTTPTLSLFALTTTVNLGLKVPLQLKFTGSGPYSYSLTGGYSGIARSDTTISVLPRGNTSYQVTSIVNGCGTGLPGNPATVTVRVPTVSTSNLNATTLCAGTSLSVPFTTTGEFNPGNAFRIELISVADTTKKYAASTSVNSSPVTSSLPTILPGGQYYVRVKADNPEVGITGSNSPNILTIRSLPTATLSGTQNIYEGIPANLTLTFGGDGPWNVTYADSLRSYPLTVTTSPYVVEARPARTTTYRLSSVSNSCGNGVLSGTAVVSVLPLLGVDDNSLDPLVKAYPVPTETILILELNLPLTRDPAIVTLTDVSGKPVLQQTTRNQLNELNLVSQPSGIYLLRIQVGNRQTVRKILKQ